MGEYCSVSIRIGGRLDRSFLEEFVVILRNNGLVYDEYVDVGQSSLQEISNAKDVIELHNYECNYGNIETTKSFCERHSLPYIYDCDGHYNEWGPSREVWLSEKDELTFDCDTDGDPVADLTELKAYWAGKSCDELIAHLEQANPTLPPFELVGAAPDVEAPTEELQEYTVIGVYEDGKGRFGTRVMARNPDHAEELAIAEADEGMVVAGVLDSDHKIVG